MIVLIRLLLIVVVVLAVIWWMRGRRQKTAEPAPPTAKPPQLAQAIVPCAYCGMHLPRQEALPGLGVALYCSEAHRRAAGDAAP